MNDDGVDQSSHQHQHRQQHQHTTNTRTTKKKKKKKKKKKPKSAFSDSDSSDAGGERTDLLFGDAHEVCLADFMPQRDTLLNQLVEDAPPVMHELERQVSGGTRRRQEVEAKAREADMALMDRLWEVLMPTMLTETKRNYALVFHDAENDFETETVAEVVWGLVFSYLEFHELTRMSLVCRDLDYVATNKGIGWKQKLQSKLRDFEPFQSWKPRDFKIACAFETLSRPTRSLDARFTQSARTFTVKGKKLTFPAQLVMKTQRDEKSQIRPQLLLACVQAYATPAPCGVAVFQGGWPQHWHALTRKAYEGVPFVFSEDGSTCFDATCLPDETPPLFARHDRCTGFRYFASQDLLITRSAHAVRCWSMDFIQQQGQEQEQEQEPQWSWSADDEKYESVADVFCVSVPEPLIVVVPSHNDRDPILLDPMTGHVRGTVPFNDVNRGGEATAKDKKERVAFFFEDRAAVNPHSYLVRVSHRMRVIEVHSLVSTKTSRRFCVAPASPVKDVRVSEHLLLVRTAAEQLFVRSLLHSKKPSAVFAASDIQLMAEPRWLVVLHGHTISAVDLAVSPRKPTSVARGSPAGDAGGALPSDVKVFRSCDGAQLYKPFFSTKMSLHMPQGRLHVDQHKIIVYEPRTFAFAFWGQSRVHRVLSFDKMRFTNLSFASDGRHIVASDYESAIIVLDTMSGNEHPHKTWERFVKEGSTENKPRSLKQARARLISQLRGVEETRRTTIFD